MHRVRTYLHRSIARSEDVYGDPDVFRPERFLDPDLDPDSSDPRNIVFGHGRRYVALRPPR